MIVTVAKAARMRVPAVHRVALDAERDIFAYLHEELRRLRADIPLDDLAQVLTSAREKEIFQVIDAPGMREVFSDLGAHLEKGAFAGARLAAEKLGKRRLVLDAARPRLKRWLSEHAGELVKQTMGTSKDAVREIVRIGVEAGRHPARLARDVQSVVGLTGPQAVAVARRREWLLSQDMPDARANELADKYADDSLKLRARTIAQNESMTAVNRGRSELWTQLAEDGAIPPEQRKRWDATRDAAVCEICAAMGKAKPILVADDWELPDGSRVNAPPAHPGCRCEELLA